MDETDSGSQSGRSAAGSLVATMVDASDTAPRVAHVSDSLPDRIGRYEILRMVGRGAVGVVLAARDPRLEREVAIKVLHETALRPRTKLELQRETRALARLMHPNIVEIFDAGQDRGRLYLVMELVVGRSLGEILRECDRLPWRRAHEVFTAVARALAAAHTAGIVHGDLKPDNVLVADDGTVKVVDFGLAQILEHATDDTTSEHAGSLSMLGADPIPQGTRARGTPAYMAPELFEAARADEKSDQFALCVSLWETMYGERPFVADSVHELAAEVVRGHVRPPTVGLVPPWLHAIAARGLRGDRLARFGSMAELASAMQRGPGRRWRLALACGGTAVALGALAFAIALPPAAASRCQGSETRWAGVWDEARRAALGAAVHADATEYALDAARGLERELDAYVTRWVIEHHRTCRATRIEHRQPPAEMDRHVACLEHQRRDVATTLDALLRIRGSVADAIPQAVTSLPAVEACRDAGSDPNARRSGAPAELWARVDALGARTSVDRDEADIVELNQLVADARATGDAAVLAAALRARGTWVGEDRDFPRARRDLEEAFFLAQADGDDATAAMLAAKLVAIVGVAEQRLGEARAWADHAVAATRRAGDPPAVRAELLWTLAEFAYACGEYEEGLSRAIEGAVSVDEASGSTRQRGQAQGQIGAGLLLVGRAAQALPHFEAAIALRSDLYGPRHPSLVIPYSDTAAAYKQAGNLERAIELLTTAKAIVDQPSLDGTRERGRVLLNLGVMLRESGRDDEAEALYRGALAAFERSYGPEHPYVAYALHNLGVLTIDRDHAEATRLLVRALDLRERELGPDHPKVAVVVVGLARAAAVRGDERAFLVHMRRALRIDVNALGREHPETEDDVDLVREVLAQAGHDDAAIEAEIERLLAPEPDR